MITRTYEITYTLTGGNSGMQKTTVQASDTGTARKVFQAQFGSGAKINSGPREVRGR